ncbi:MAG: UDP-N-acetylmuramoyl-L-alanyl-D-glutamate--2,6-diaminopimelate ligase [Clostridia bacterium]
MKLKELLKGVEIELIPEYENIEISGIAYDSRKVENDNLFICIKGFKADGHDFISQAIKNGAAAIIVEKEISSLSAPQIKVNNSREVLALVAAAFYNHPSSKFKLVGITGTNGKTTTTYLIKTILEQQGSKVGLIGTNQNMIGNEVLPAERTTPESLELQKLFADMAEEKVDYVVMEVSSHSLELYRTEGCNFEVGVFTNITQDHLDFHITMENYLKAKTKLFQRCKIGIINADDRESNYILEHGTCKMMTYSIEEDANIKANNIKVSSKGVEFDIVAPQGEQSIELGIPGKFSVYNALGSIGACLALEVDLQLIQQGLRLAKGVPGRAQVVDLGKDFTVLIDYAHTPDGLENILGAVAEFTQGRVITLFGCGGDRDRTKRPIMGKIAGAISDFCVVTSDNPRTEDPMHIIYQVEEGLKYTGCPYIIIENRRQAIEYVLKNAKKDDVIVLAGKGHETYQEINGIKYPFDENEVVKEILSKMDNYEFKIE